MELAELRSLLEALISLPPPDKQEPNLFSIGARGHYENPVTDLLAFFFYPDAGHGLGTLALESLLACLPDSQQPVEASLLAAPEREVSTKLGNRIDILMESDEWLLVLENKIWHKQNNPFSDYSDYLAEIGRKQDKACIYVVLSPEGESPEGWSGISYKSLIAELSARSGKAFVSFPFSKWLILLREFILHLESLMASTNISPDTEDFVLNNLGKIQEIVSLKSSVIKSLQEEGLCYLTREFSDHDYNVQTRLHHWYGYPALRFAFEHWTDSSDVCLYLDGSPGNAFDVRTYVCDLHTEALCQYTKQFFSQEVFDHQWEEGNSSVMGFQRLMSGEKAEKRHLFDEIARQMKKLNEFEQQHRQDN